MSRRLNSEADGIRSDKILPCHLERLAVVYVRQSTMQQVVDHQESTRVQYGLVGRAQALGWPKERTLVIDADLGKSATTTEGRVGFQRLVFEVSLDHVGLILGVDISRLARSSKDWHQLLELCALFKTLISDLDGVYDPGQFNDRLLLGLKGTMSEAELHILKQRMRQGLISKAQRGALVYRVPTGYVRSPLGEVTFDPDEQVQQVIKLIFRKFDELRTLNALLRYLVKHDVKLGMRVYSGPRKGELEWHASNRMTLQDLLKHPIYTGAYVYGRRQIDHRKQKPEKPGSGRTYVPQEQWIAFLKDRLPAYISWEQFERNLAQLEANQSRGTYPGAVRGGAALLTGLLICGKCGQRISIQYTGNNGAYSYCCYAQVRNYAAPPCQHIAGKVLDEFVTQQVLDALQPAALEVSLAAAAHLEQERNELHCLWQQRLERAAFEAERAGRHYQLVEPENRLVARQLAQQWEQKLSLHQQLQHEYERFVQQQPLSLSRTEQQNIRQLAKDIPNLWQAPTTSQAQRKEIIRQLIMQILVDVQGNSEKVHVTIEWIGSATTKAVLVRPVAKLTQLSYYPQLCQRIRTLRTQGVSAQQIAKQLNQEGFRPPKRSLTFTESSVQGLFRTLGLTKPLRTKNLDDQLEEHECWLLDLAQRLEMPPETLYRWVQKGLVQARQLAIGNRRWVLWADEAEIKRLRQFRNRSLQEEARHRWLNQSFNEIPMSDENQ